MENSEYTPHPWYREPWPWLILGILGLGVCSGLGILTIGLNNPPHIVSGDYQPLGKALVDTHERTGRAKALGLSGDLRFEGGEVVLNLVADELAGLPDTVLVQFLHPATSDGDTTAIVRLVADGVYRGELSATPHERAQVRVADLQQTWWLAGRLYGDAPDIVALTAQRL
jgi:uncharacterized protein